MTKIIRYLFTHASFKERVDKELQEAMRQRLEATAQREYWTAMEQMLARRVVRLSKEYTHEEA